MPYAWLRKVLPLLGLTYVLAGFAATRVQGYEIFPFFCWFLFPVAPNVEERYALMVEQIGGRTLDPATDFQELDLVEDPHAMDVWFSVQALGGAIESGDTELERRIRERLEANFLPKPSRYAIERVSFDPLERWTTGAIRHREHVETFTSTTGCEASPWAYAR
ncbi:MAG: hypothetical protein HC923_04895 [Myxococcales bacterium]|nr:hypothetical protein [Myxococcales bacterium]